MGRRSEHTREELTRMVLESAEHIVAEQGMAGLTMRKVAADIGYTVGSLYMIFKNQDDMIVHINGRTIEAIYKAMSAAAENKRTATTRIRAIARAYVDYAHENPGRYRMAYEHHLPEGELAPRELIRDRVARVYELTQDALRPFMPSAPDADVATAAAALWSGVHGMTILALSNRLNVIGRSSVVRLCDFLIDSTIEGLQQRYK